MPDDRDDDYVLVHQNFATVQDLIDDAEIMRRKAARLRAEAEAAQRQGDEALRRAKGNRAVLLKDIADK